MTVEVPSRWEIGMDRVVDAIGDLILRVLEWCREHWVISLVIVFVLIGRVDPEGTIGFVRDQLSSTLSRFIVPMIDMLIMEFLGPSILYIGVPLLACWLIFRGFRKSK